MIDFQFMRDLGVLVVTPDDELKAEDFSDLALLVDPYIEANGQLNGLMIYSHAFPHWHDFAALISHFRFIHNHHQLIKKVAAVSDSDFLSIMPSVVSHFIAAEVRHFDYHDKDAALAWLTH